MTPLDFLGFTVLGGRFFLPDREVGSLLEVSTSVDGDLTIAADGDGVTISITEPDSYAGTYLVTMAEFAEGPILLTAPQILGDVEVGGTLTVLPALWLYESSHAEPIFTTIWKRDGIDIPDANDLIYGIVAADAGAELEVFETASGANGASIAVSQTVSVPALPSDAIAELFAANELGFVLLPGTEYGACYQETTAENATTPCVHGDPVGTYFDTVSGLYATAPTDGQRPIYRDTGTSVYLDFSASGDRRLSVPLDMSSTDKILGVIGANKQNGSSFGVICELTQSSASVDGGFSISQAGSDASGWNVRARGTRGQTASVGDGFPAGTSDTVTGVADLAESSLLLRVNGNLIASSTANLGGGNFANDILYIGGRSDGLVTPFSGALFGLVVRGGASDAAQVTALETYVAARIGEL